MLTVRLTEQMEKDLNAVAKKCHLTKSEIVKEAVSEYLIKKSLSPYEAGKDLFGCDESDISNGSTSYKKDIRRKINEKYSS